MEDLAFFMTVMMKILVLSLLSSKVNKVRSTSAAVAPADRFLLCLADLVEMCIEEVTGP